ncbi:MAG: MFS transporter [Planctomycetes bacterium]|nr:MFS transporter [Planctomycetota bacterium]
MSNTWPKDKRREVFSWCLFDFANSSFTTVIVTVVFSKFFTDAVARDDGDLWSVALTVSNGLIILSAPFVGAIADRSSRKKRFLLASYLTCVLFTALLYGSGPSVVAWSFVCFVIANLAFASGENLVSAFLPEIVEPDEIGKVSGWGWGIGYLGGLLSLVICIPLVETGRIAATNLVVAAFFLLAGLPTFLFVRERTSQRPPARPALGGPLREAFAEVRATLQHRHALPELFRFLLAYVVFSTGVYGVIQFASILGSRVFGLDDQALIRAFILAQVTAAIGALLVGPGIARLGGLRFIRCTLILWTLVGLTALTLKSQLGFWLIAGLAGLAMGATLAGARAVVGIFCPRSRSGEIFGFWGLAGRTAAILAPAGNFCLLKLTSFGPRAGLYYFTASFLLGLWLLRGIDEAKGRARVTRTGDAALQETT